MVHSILDETLESQREDLKKGACLLPKVTRLVVAPYLLYRPQTEHRV